MKLISRILGSSLGKKYVMAVTGAFLFAFVTGHMIGNLQVFLGPEAINRYGHFLQSNVELLWPVRIGLLALVALHIWSAVKLSAENRAARPAGYADQKIVAASFASRTMLMSGLIIAAFVIYHILHFTVRVPAMNLIGTDFHKLALDAEQRHDVYRMMIMGFSNVWVSLFYIIAMTLLFLHLSHGIAAMFQSLGVTNRAWGPVIARFAQVVSWIIYIGYISIPIAILLGFGKEAA